MASAQQDDEGGPRPDVFRGDASSLAVAVQADREALIPVPDLLRFIALDGSGIYQTSNQQARASIIFPGNGGIQGPGLACSQLPTAQFPPTFQPIFAACAQYNYPLTVFADGLTPDQQTDGSVALGTATDPISGNAVAARAHAGPDASTTDAVMNDLTILGLPAVGGVPPSTPGFDGLEPTLLRIDSAASRTDQRILDGDLVIDAISELSGVSILGGTIRIGSIVSHSRIVDADDAEPVIVNTFEMTGVTAAGIPAQVTDEGLVVGQPDGLGGPLLDALQGQVTALLEQMDVRFEILPATQGIEPSGIAFAQIGGVLVEFALPVSGLPTIPVPHPDGSPVPDVGALDLNGRYVGTMQFGATGARGIAASFDDPVRRPPGSLGGGGFGPVGGLPGSGGGFTPAPAGAVTGGAAPAAVPPAATPAVPQSPVSFIDELLADRMRLLYLGFTLAALALCIAPRLSLPARLPRRM